MNAFIESVADRLASQRSRSLIHALLQAVYGIASIAIRNESIEREMP